jgi:hypothetical protein
MDKVQKYNSFNTNTPSSESYRENKSGDRQDSFYDEVQRVTDQFPKYHVKNFVRSFQCKNRERR